MWILKTFVWKHDGTYSIYKSQCCELLWGIITRISLSRIVFFHIHFSQFC
ncbi:hypothetical protein EGR_10158 [Echinococcus granulosus]|uniref:Uncharacterized protein n=1 Tax=Echinococcus granulosus TaxID=6210 RepID=W6UNP8_ECHGR|nr:hypothetical protein EGR_10158 [Echinococcus granulosus]EUB54974.1 hypothetical protein EGR_10158 [Echinococcus granulosus]